MRDFFLKLLGLVVCWGALFAVWEYRDNAIPEARAWISNPVLELRKTLDHKLTRNQRLHLSYLLPGIYPIDYVCAEFAPNAKSHPIRALLPGDIFRKEASKKSANIIRCGNGLVLTFGLEATELSLTRGEAGLAFDLHNGFVSWDAAPSVSNPIFSLVLSYLSMEVEATKLGSQGSIHLDGSSERMRLLLNSPASLRVWRPALPNYFSPMLEINGGEHSLALRDFGRNFTVSRQGKALLSAASLRQWKSSGGGG